MKCSCDRFNVTLNLLLLKLVLTYIFFNMECVVAGDSKKENSILMDFDYLVSQLYLQQCTFVEIGEGICSLFVELTVNNGCKKLQRQMFFGNCLCSEFRKWHLCNYQLTNQRPEDCTFQEGTTCPSSSARVHRRLCDVTGMSQWNAQCNCSIALAGDKQDHLCGFRTCYVSPMPKSICGPLTVCGTAHCDLRMHDALYSVRCDRKCRYHQPFCEDPGPETSHRRPVTSEWAEWRSVSSPDSNCNIKQFETECLNERKEPAYDCIGPGLLCCGKDEADCTCEVKIQDGKLRAFRYMITFADHCETEDSRIKVRSTGLKGDAKVWSRFIGIPTKEDKEDSISMFGKPVGFESYRRNYIPDGQKNMVSYGMDDSLQESGKTDARLFQQLASLITNRTQSHKNIQGVNLHNVSGINSTAKFESPDLKKLPANKTAGSVKLNPQGQQLGKQNGGQLQIIPNNSTINTNLNPNLQNQQKDVQQIKISKENSPFNSTLLPNNNTIKIIELLGKNISNGHIMTVGVGNISNNINQNPIKDAKSSAEQGVINEGLNTANSSTEHQHNYNIQKLSENSVASRPDMSKNENIQIENPVITNHESSSALNKMTTNRMENSVANVKTEINTSEQQNKDKKETLEVLNYINNPQKPLSTKSDNQEHNKLGKTSDNNKEYQGEKVDTNTKEAKIENYNKDEDSSIDYSYKGSIMSEIKSDELKKAEATLEKQTKNFKVLSELNSDNSKEKDVQESDQIENVVNQEELSEIPIREDRAKSQDKISVHDEDRSEINGKGYYQVVFPEQHSSEQEIINKKITPTQQGSTTHLIIGQKVSTKKSYNNKYTHPMSPSQHKEKNINGPPNHVKYTTVGLEYNKVSHVNAKSNERNIDDQNLKKSSLNKLPNAEFVEYTSIASISEGQNKGESRNKQAVNKKASLDRVAQTFPNATVQSQNKQDSVKKQAVNKNGSLTNIVNILTNTTHDGTKNSPNEIPGPGINPQKSNGTSAIPKDKSNEESVNKQTLNKKTPLNEIANILPNGAPYGVTEMTKKTRVNPHLDKENEENVINLSIQTKTTPDLWGSIARRLFKSHSQGITDDQQNLFTLLSDSNPSFTIPEEKPSNDYDEPEPVLKDLNKVDKDNVDEKMAEALSKIADISKLPGKVVWSEKSENNNCKSDLEKNKNQNEKECINSSKKTPMRNERVEKRRRIISKLKPSS